MGTFGTVVSPAALAACMSLFPCTGAVAAADTLPARGSHEWVRSYRQVAALESEQKYDEFGGGLALEGSTLLVGAPDYEVDDVSGVGTVFLYRRQPDSGSWERRGELRNPEPGRGAWFGDAIAIQGTTVVVSAPAIYAGDGTVGAVYVFAAGRPTAELAPGDATDVLGFGKTLDLDGDTLIVGAPDSADDQGLAFIFERDELGAWSEVARLAAPDGMGTPIDSFGWDVALDGDVAVVGAPDDDSPIGMSSGSAYVFEHDAGGPEAWGLTARLTASDAREYHDFGSRVDVSADLLVVGAWQDDDLGYRAGAVYTFGADRRGAWRELGKLHAPDGQSFDNFYGARLEGDRLAVGATGVGGLEGAVYMFDRGEELGEWEFAAKFTASDSDPDNLGFGFPLDLDGPWTAVGALSSNGIDKSQPQIAFVFQSIPTAPTLEITGECPGTVRASLSRFTPETAYSLFAGPDAGGSQVDLGPCLDLRLDVGPPHQVLEGFTNDDGAATRSFELGEQGCEHILQALDRTTCTTSGVGAVP